MTSVPSQTARDETPKDVHDAVDALTFRAARGPEVRRPTRPRIHRLLLAYDGSTGAQPALEWARELAKAHGASVAVAAVHAPPQVDVELVGAYGWWPRYLEEHARVQESLREAVDRAAETLRAEGIEAKPFLRQGRPVAELARLAEREGADLVVLGSHGRGPLGRAMLGSVGGAILDRVEASVLVARTPPRPAHVLVAVDGSHTSRRALALALRQASETGATLVVQHVLEHPDASPPPEGFLKSVVERLQLPAAPPRVRYVLDVGRPAARIVDRAQEEGCGLVVMGSRGLGSFVGTLLGSVSRRVVHEAACSVLVVRDAPHEA